MRALILVLTLAAALVASPPARAQSVPPDAMAAARELVGAMKMTEQLKTVFPMMMQSLKPAVTQGRPEVEKDYDKLVP